MFCPKCRSEYRSGIDTCKACSVALVAEIPSLKDLEDPILEGEDTRRVGVSGERGISHVVAIGGRDVDLRNSFPYDVAVELVRDLEQEHLPSVLREVDGKIFPDRKPRYEVHVRVRDHERATQALHDRWKKLAEAEAGASGAADDVEKCPACGAAVALDVEECPDCGLFVGKAEDEAAGDEEAAEA